MTDAASQFLSRKEHRSIQKKLRRGEAPKAMVPCIHDGRHGLLCSTRTRILFSARKGLGTKVRTWQRRALGGVGHEKKRYGTVLLKTKKGTLRFEMTQRGMAQEFLDSLAPPGHRGRGAGQDVVEFRVSRGASPHGSRVPPPGAPAASTAAGRPAARPPAAGRAGRPVGPAAAPEPDRLAHRDTAAHKARLRRMLERGIITKREYEWQTESV